MSAVEAAIRDDIVREARTWLGTPWHHAAMVKGAGVDCAHLLIGVYAGVGLIESFTPEAYPCDWHLHRNDPRFMADLLRYCIPTQDPKHGDIGMYQFARAAAHGGIYLGDGLLLHAYRDEGRVTITELANAALAERFVGFYKWSGFP